MSTIEVLIDKALSVGVPETFSILKFVFNRRYRIPKFKNASRRKLNAEVLCLNINWFERVPAQIINISKIIINYHFLQTVAANFVETTRKNNFTKYYAFA